MICSECKSREAEVFYKQIVGDKVTQRALCQPCAQGLTHSALSAPDQLLMQVLAGLGGLVGGPPAAQQALQCPTCGLRYAQFKETGRLGCADCYESFRKPLGDLLRRIHGSDQHRGKLPRGSREAAERTRRAGELQHLQRALKAAIEGERFEEAARLRDQIQGLHG